MLLVTIGVYGKKLKMTQCVVSIKLVIVIFSYLGTFTPVTIVEIGPNLVTQVKPDKYYSIKLAYDEITMK